MPPALPGHPPAQQPAESLGRQLVVIGSSAGGIEALSVLVSTLPAGFPAPIVVAQHLDPRRTSHLREILGARGPLPVETVADRADLRPGVIYVVPANRHVQVTDHAIQLVEATGERPAPSVDRLLSSAAAIFGEGLIAVILTGTGSDGAQGARDVKQAGGTVIIENPETASFAGMPLSLAPTTVDVVANLQAIGPLLHDLVSGAYLPERPDEDRTLRTFLEHLRERSGVDFSAYKRPTILRRLQRRMAASGITRFRDYVRYTHKHPDELQKLVSSFLIKVTEFNRDPDLFAYLREQVVPDIVQEARRRSGEIRLWSAGCATGEEAYSLALLVADVLGDELEHFSVRIFATDLDADAIEFGRRGVYPVAALAGLAPELRQKYFLSVGADFEVHKRLRGLVIFGQHDLGQRAPFPRTDLVLCRNVLIYFTAELQRRALQLFAFSLRDGGYLALGKAETTSPLVEFFAVEQPRLKVFRRHGSRALIPGGHIKQAAPILPPGPRAPGGGRLAGSLDQALPRLQRDTLPARPAGERAEGLLLHLPVGVVTVDRRYDIQTINNAARRLLRIHKAAIGEDVVHLAEGLPSAALRAAIDRAARGEPSTLRLAMAPPPLADAAQHLELAFAPHPADANPEVVLITVVDGSGPAGEQQRLEAALAQEAQRRQQAEEQLRAAEARVAQLLAANQDLTSVNADLRSANEELLVATEEVQSATEEVETLNEELQATVEELNTTNDDLQARSVEMQDLAASLEEQRLASDAARSRLEVILASMADAVLVVDATGQPLLTNAAFDQLFPSPGWQPQDEAGQPLPADATPQARAARGETFRMDFTTPDSPGSGERRRLEAQGQPIHAAAPDRGGVVVIRDVTDRRVRRLQEEFLAFATHELRTPLTALSGFLEMLRRRLPEDADERVRRYADMAQTQAQRMADLVAELLDVARLESDKLTLRRERVDLRDVVQRAVDVAHAIVGERLPIQAPRWPEPLLVDGDPRRLEQVVFNLLTNAAKHAAGSVRLDVRVRADGPADALVEVQDYGPGIPPKDLPRIFNRYFQGEPAPTADGEAGLGLGLYIARGIVEAHGGTLEAASPPGHGATFTVRLPLLPPAHPEPVEGAP